MATDSRIDKTIGLFCRILSLLQGSFTKETYNFIDPTNQSHPIAPHVPYIPENVWISTLYIHAFAFTYMYTHTHITPHTHTSHHKVFARHLSTAGYNTSIYVYFNIYIYVWGGYD